MMERKHDEAWSGATVVAALAPNTGMVPLASGTVLAVQRELELLRGLLADWRDKGYSKDRDEQTDAALGREPSELEQGVVLHPSEARNCRNAMKQQHTLIGQRGPASAGPLE